MPDPWCMMHNMRASRHSRGSRILTLALAVGFGSVPASCALSQTSSGSRQGIITTADIKGSMAASCVRETRYYEKGVPLFRLRPVTVQIGNDVGIAIYGKSSSNPGICVVSNFGSWNVGGPGHSIAPDARPVEVVTSGIGLDNEIWALVRVPLSTTSVDVALPKGRASTLLLDDGYAVVSFTNDRVGPKRRWPEPPRVTFKLGTVTAFDREGFTTGSDVVTVCYAAPEFCGRALKFEPAH
jgi:hypothetical protein